MIAVGLVLLAIPFVCFGYAYAAYPALLWLASRFRREPDSVTDPAEWPVVTITVPAYNEERRIRSTIESLLEIDYPPNRRQILIASDGSTDGTDAIVREYSARGVELVHVAPRGGKTNAENHAASAIRGDIVVNTDASIRVHPASVKALVRAFQDPSVGVASGRDVSVGDVDQEANRGESGYVGYEMWVRALETRLGSIVGASGCCYAARVDVQRTVLPGDLARDFASALIAHQKGLRAVSVASATCVVPRTTSLRAELRRKVRTMAQGLETLWHFRGLSAPWSGPAFSFMLTSHKLGRWLVYLSLPLALVGLVLLCVADPRALVLAGLAVLVLALGYAAIAWPDGRRVPLPIALCGFVVVSTLAGVLAWLKFLRRQRMPTWEPTRRPDLGGQAAK
ncbi:MAG TPA: glycosyltransferase [Gemmatimonadaceae bacterium]|nr:glycosyltransferase [Gemmatimonadaceae bacterium]